MEPPRDRLVISAMGANQVGVVARISRVLADHSVDIVSITQQIVESFFVMLLVADMTGARVSREHLVSLLKAEADALGIQIVVQHEKLFRYMHRV